MSVSISYLPQPFGDLVEIWSRDLSSRSSEMEAKETKIMFRLSLVAAQFFLYYRVNFSFPTVASLGFAFSLPSTTLFFGMCLLDLAWKNVYENVLLSLACVATSWFCFSKHEKYTWGFLERFLHAPRSMTELVPNTPLNQVWIERSAYTSYTPQNSLIERLTTYWNTKGKFSELQEVDEVESGIFSYKSLAPKLNTPDVIEFFYCFQDIDLNHGNARNQGKKITARNHQQIYYGCFSNTFSKSFICDGIKWASREHYIQAMRFKEGSSTYLQIKEAQNAFATPQDLLKEVSKKEHSADLREGDWEVESFHIAMHANFAYFAQHQEDRENLLATDKIPLVQRNDKHDIWGISYRDGTSKLFDENNSPINRNRQGWILMYLRNYFRN